MRDQTMSSCRAIALVCALSFATTLHAQDGPSPTVNNSALNAPLFYQILLGEMQFRSGENLMAHQLLLDAARKSNDESVYRRASNMALQMRDGPLALAAIRAWRQGLPDSLEASRYELQILLALQRPVDAAASVGTLIRLTPKSERSALFASLPRLLSRSKDPKELVQRLEPVLAPWLKDASTKTAAQLMLARLLLAAGNSDRALEMVQKAHRQAPTDEGPALLALELHASSAEAESVIADFLKAVPAATEFRVAYARILAGQQRHAQAAAQLEAVRQAAPKMGAPWLTLGALYLDLKQPVKTMEVVQEYLNRVRSADIVAAPSTQAHAASSSGESHAATVGDGGTDEHGLTQAYFLLAKAAQQQRDYPGASAWLDKITAPQQAMDVLLQRAVLLAEQGQLPQARQLVQSAPDSSPDAARDKIAIEVQLLSDAKEWVQAEALLARANQRFPNDSDLMYQQSMAAEKLNRMGDVERLLKRVIEIKPDYFHAYNALGYSWADRNMHLHEAKELIVKALTMAPGEPTIMDSLGWVEYRLGNRAEALRLLRQAYRLRPDVEIGAHLAEVLWVGGQTDEARLLLREIRTKDAENDVLRETISRLQVDL